MSGHMDSWDFGSGAMDDGQGWATGWTAMEAIAQLTQASGGGESPAPVLPAPKRTLRTIHWAAEEWGSQGAADYWSSGVQDPSKISLGMGDDNGAFTPTSFAFTGSDDARLIIEAIVFMLRENGIDVDVTEGGGFEGSGQVPDVPRGTVDNNGGNPDWAESGDAFRGNYFFFHHTAADTMTTLDTVDMDLNTAMYAAIAYVVADLDDLLPRDDGTLYCTGAHFPEGVNVPQCNCTTVDPKAHHNVSRVSAGIRTDLAPCRTGWPNQEYYTPHSGRSVHDGHWANARPVARELSKHH